jgi:hypothetical protein
LSTLIYCSSGQPKTWNGMDQGCKGNYKHPTLYQSAFPNTPDIPDSSYWSSSVDANGPAFAWLVHFLYGGVSANY